MYHHGSLHENFQKGVLEREHNRPCPCGQSSEHKCPQEEMAVLLLGPGTQSVHLSLNSLGAQINMLISHSVLHLALG